ncbi:hypothetical protein ZEAMMB73_Zm00001d049564 [Zea mays]|jgi:uncharacterized membrane protein|uniref:DUF599 family protein n=1 Tax=Zea mays TaxID=4577 RepID=K7UBM2_MAIZE|nr:hypothetical protein ZEAMMB73_Zm00001d049564 [Zea mays]
MGMKKEELDYVLVPLGLAVMAGYHAWLLLRVRRQPATTVIGVNAINRRIWVRHIMEVGLGSVSSSPHRISRALKLRIVCMNACKSRTDTRFSDVILDRLSSQEPSGKHAVLAVQTIRNNIMASTLLASTAITLSSLIAVLMSSGDGGGATAASSSKGGLLPGAPLVVGATGAPALSAKFFAILVCFLVAFLLNVQSIRYYSHASVLVNVPAAEAARRRRAVGYVTDMVNRGSYFWSLGARAFYFSCPVFLWLFGPIPMFVACVALVCALYFLDVCKDWEEEEGDGHGHRCTSDDERRATTQGKDAEQQV